MGLQSTCRSQRRYSDPKGKAVYAHMGIWRQGDSIHITIPKEDFFHTTVNSKDGSVRCHKNLYNKLKELLEKNKCWE